jgi:hypothetical protein
MRIHGHITLNKRRYAPGDEVSPLAVYPTFFAFFLVFCTPTYLLAYLSETPDVGGVYALGIFGSVFFLGFYLTIFGPDEVKWMLVNAALGVFGIFGQISWIMSTFFFKAIDELSWYVHVMPFLIFVLFTFLARQALTDLLGGRDNEARRRVADILHVVVSVALSGASLFVQT